MNFRDNGFVSILGPSGSGKTTLLNIIGGLDRYDTGDLIINNVSTKKYKDRDWDLYCNHTIGFVFQSYNLIPHQTVLANVELALTIGGISKKERKKRAIGASKKNISSFFNAETFFVGLFSGIIGIITTLILLIPINRIIHSLTNNNNIMAVLPVQGGIVLIILSVILKLIG